MSLIVTHYQKHCLPQCPVHWLTPFFLIQKADVRALDTKVLESDAKTDLKTMFTEHKENCLQVIEKMNRELDYKVNRSDVKLNVKKKKITQNHKNNSPIYNCTGFPFLS